MIYETRRAEYVKVRVLWPVSFKFIGYLKTLTLPIPFTRCLFAWLLILFSSQGDISSVLLIITII